MTGLDDNLNGEQRHSLRKSLREGTAVSHDNLDAMLGSLDLTNPVEYARFLRVQLAARRPIEAWLARQAIAGIAAPPAQAKLIERDLMIIGASAGSPSDRTMRFTPSAASDNAMLGILWVLAGSALGNRMMLRRLQRAMPMSQQPHYFLSDKSMSQYWNTLRPLLEHPADAQQSTEAIAAAQSVFDRFLSIAQNELIKVAA